MVTLSGPSVFSFGRLFIIDSILNRHRPFQIIYSFLCEFWEIVFFKQLVHFIWVIKFVGIELFLVFLFNLFNAHGTCSDVPFFNSFFFFFLILFIYLFTYGCVGSSSLCEGLLQLRQAGATLHRGAWAPHYRGLSRCGAQAPDTQAQ